MIFLVLYALVLVAFWGFRMVRPCEPHPLDRPVSRKALDDLDERNVAR